MWPCEREKITYRFESFARIASLRSDRIFANVGNSDSEARSGPAVVVDSLAVKEERRKRRPAGRRHRLVLIILSDEVFVEGVLCG